MITDLLNKKVITEVFTEEEKKQLEGKSLEELKDMKLVTLVEVDESTEETPTEPVVEVEENTEETPTEPVVEVEENTEETPTEPVVEDDEDLPVVDEEE